MMLRDFSARSGLVSQRATSSRESRQPASSSFPHMVVPRWPVPTSAYRRRFSVVIVVDSVPIQDLAKAVEPLDHGFDNFVSGPLPPIVARKYLDFLRPEIAGGF